MINECKDKSFFSHNAFPSILFLNLYAKMNYIDKPL